MFSIIIAALLIGGLTAEQRNAPNFRIRDINKQWVELNDLTAKGPVILDFWALWCVPCRKELPHLEALYKKYSDKGLTIVAVNQDDISSEAKVRPFVKSRRLTFPVVVDTEKEIYRLYKVAQLPTLIFINRKGKIFSVHTGYRPGDEKALEAEIEQLLSREAGEEIE